MFSRRPPSYWEETSKFPAHTGMRLLRDRVARSSDLPRKDADSAKAADASCSHREEKKVGGVDTRLAGRRRPSAGGRTVLL